VSSETRSCANVYLKGSITQWGEVSKVKKSKAKDATVSTFGDATNTGKVSRGGRGGAESGRGRGRGAERSRGSRGRGASTAQTNGSRKENAVPATESTAWDATTTTETPAWDTKPAGGENSWDTSAAPTTVVAQVASSIIPDGVKKSWASMFAPAPAPASKKAPEPVEKYEPLPNVYFCANIFLGPRNTPNQRNLPNLQQLNRKP